MLQPPFLSPSLLLSHSFLFFLLSTIYLFFCHSRASTYGTKHSKLTSPIFDFFIKYDLTLFSVLVSNLAFSYFSLQSSWNWRHASICLAPYPFSLWLEFCLCGMPRMKWIYYLSGPGITEERMSVIGTWPATSFIHRPTCPFLRRKKFSSSWFVLEIIHILNDSESGCHI